MSENSEHSPDDTETETKTIEDLPNDSSKSETKLMMNQTMAGLLEDEEMPTYISVSSISRRDDSDAADSKQQENVSMGGRDDSDAADSKQQENVSMEERSPSPYPSDDQGASSVYVLSSGEESKQIPYNDEDEEDEYGDSDDMENLELDNEMDPEHPSNIKHLMDEEDDDDDEEDEEDDEESPGQMHDDDDDDDEEEEDMDECCDRFSADFILSKGLKRRDKESSSLQDLSVYKNMCTKYNKKRYPNIMKQEYLNIPQNTVMLPVVRRKQMPEKYQHVQSKVKLYIKNIKEYKCKRSTEKHVKSHEDAAHNKSNIDYKNNDIGEIKPVTANKTIKNYTGKTVKELEKTEACDKDKTACNASSILNGQDNKSSLKPTQEENIPTRVKIQINSSFESLQDKSNTVNSDDKVELKQNGIIEIISSEKESQQFENSMPMSLIQNGHQEMPTMLFNLRTLSYEEYMRGALDSSQKTDLNQNAHINEQEHAQSETYNNAEPMDVCEMDNEDTVYPLKIENIKSIKTDEIKSNHDQRTFDKLNEEFNKTTSDNLEVIALKNQLNQKTIQYNNLRDTYQKQLAENIKMKQELEKLRKSLAEYEEKKPVEQKVASIQTDFIIDPVTDNHQAKSTQIKQSNNKISGNSISTLSSIEQWSDSTCNIEISMKPPETVKTIHSDDSMVLVNNTPTKNTHSLSRAFITSSRILQTLSSITQGKSKPESPLVQNSKKRANENAVMELQNDDNNYQNQPSSSKKRKITDTLESLSLVQSFKTSETTTESFLKLNEMPNTESKFKYSCDSINEKLETQEISSGININQLDNATSVKNNTENIDDPEDNVKCFVYHENENSKDRSFLILAEEPAKDKIINEKERIRECGPFLLGNVEVRMSEINGTISIWGKEINDESINENENEMDTSVKMKNDKKCWQKVSCSRFNGGNIVCSSSKKSKTPAKLDFSLAGSNISCPHLTSLNTSKPSCSTDRTDNQCNLCISSFEDCDSSKPRKEWLKYKRIHPQEKSHSSCTHNVNVLGQKCSCFLHKEKQKSDDYNCDKEKLSVKEHRRSCSQNLEPNKHLNENILNTVTEDNELACRHTACHHSSHNLEENFPENHKYNSTSKRASVCEQLTMNTDQEYIRSCNRHSNVDDQEPLISRKQFNETPETRRRRLKGKKVRGIIMDLLRGCGDCYSPNTASNKGYSHRKNASYSMSCSPKIEISPCSSPEPLHLRPRQSDGRCCHAYAQRIESQLEEFRVEMEKMRSRSDAILNMLHMLHSVDAN